MPKKISENQEKMIVTGFLNGETLNELSVKFNCTAITITRYLKKSIKEKEFKELVKKNKNKFKSTKKMHTQLDSEINSNTLKDDSNNDRHKVDREFIEIAPINFQIDNESQKDLSSVSISEVDFPKVVYMVVDNKLELEIKLLGDYPDWQFLSQEELKRKTIQIFFDIKIAKRFCSKEQKVIKVPNTDVFRIVSPLLLSKGISRIISPDYLIAL